MQSFAFFKNTKREPRSNKRFDLIGNT